MRKVFAAGVLIPALLFGASAEARTNWQGEVMVIATTPSCSRDGWEVGMHALATFLPANIDNNGTSTFLALHFNRRNAYSIRVLGSFSSPKTYSAVGITSAGSNFTFNGSLLSATIFSGPITISTNFVTMRASISNWVGVSGCTLTISGAFVRRL